MPTAPTPTSSPTATPRRPNNSATTRPPSASPAVYALARLADDWEEQRQVCIDVLCAYLRMPYQPDPDASGYKEGERATTSA